MRLHNPSGDGYRSDGIVHKTFDCITSQVLAFEYDRNVLNLCDNNRRKGKRRRFAISDNYSTCQFIIVNQDASLISGFHRYFRKNLWNVFELSLKHFFTSIELNWVSSEKMSWPQDGQWRLRSHPLEVIQPLSNFGSGCSPFGDNAAIQSSVCRSWRHCERLTKTIFQLRLLFKSTFIA